MKKINYILSLCLVIALTIGSISAVRTATATTVNTITSGKIDITLCDNTSDGKPFPTEGVSGVWPGQTIDKIVYVINNCTQPEWIRVSLTNSIITNPETGESTSLDASNLMLNINTTMWTDGEDGWYYYNEVLEPGKETVPLFTTVTFKETMSNEYENSTAQIIVNAQGVQAEHNQGSAIQGWPGTDVESVEITSASTIKTSPVALTTSSVKYNGERAGGGFIYAPESTDMFQGFKGVMPGDTIAQDIILHNDSYVSAIKVYMYAEPVSDADADFLSNMAIAVYNGDILLSDGNAALQNGFENKKFIGAIGAGGKITLTANLNVNVAMGNKFQDTSGDVIWKFYIEEVPVDTTDVIRPPMTGDTRSMVAYVVISSISVILMLVLTADFIAGKNKRVRERIK